VEEVVSRRTTAYVILTGLFVASLTASNFLASKIFAASFTVLGHTITLLAPAAVAAYALTFTFTDIISEIYGRQAANLAVRLGFATQLLVLGYALIALNLPAATIPNNVSDETFSAVIGSSSSIILASLTAYLISQHHDVWAFHLWKKLTRGKWLWLRNNASTLVSQLIDTVIFISLAFSIIPALTGGNARPANQIFMIIVGQYTVKMLIALLDTPIVYAGVMFVKSYIRMPVSQVEAGMQRGIEPI
jgi:uncharacterized integral membrane protein (TIGR00697 family)